MPKTKPDSQKRADRDLCPAPAANVMQTKVHVIARWMRSAGVTDPLTTQNARAWKADPSSAPEWFIALLAERAARASQRAHRERQAAIEHEHRMMVLRDKVEKQLLAGARRLRSPDAERIALDIAFRASKELVRSCTDVCGDTTQESMTDLDTAALRWAGVDPSSHLTWIVHRGDCPA